MATPFTVPVAIPADWSNTRDLEHFLEISRRNPDKRVERTAAVIS